MTTSNRCWTAATSCSPVPITIGHNVWVGGGATICPGMTIGDDAVIGAANVETRNVPAGATVVGNPARAIRQA